MNKNTVLVAGGAGFVGASLVRRYLDDGWRVVVVDNLSTGRLTNIEGLTKNSNFIFVKHDICEPLPSDIKENFKVIINLASPASPPKYQQLSIETLMVGVVGTKNLLDLAKEHGCRFFHASTSEVYGNPDVHPQPESYRGSVNCYGPRSMYDEAKRAAEAMIYSYREKYGVDTVIARFFNTYGPFMDPEDGRVVSNLIVQGLTKDCLTMYGDGTQTRSFCYIDDLVEAIAILIASNEEGPMNIGNPAEFTINELAVKIQKILDRKLRIKHLPLPGDDPLQRKPDISYATSRLDWKPKIELDEGLTKTIDYFRSEINIS